MPIDNITNLDAFGFIVGVAVLAVILVRIIPGSHLPPRLQAYGEAEITSYDSSLPKYFLVSILALALGGLHAAVKSIPPVYAWLTEAGRGGHMVRDLANTHLVIVVGGTVAATGLVWYVLPRVARRPLYSNLLAQWSFWLTVTGALGFYVSNIGLGIVYGEMAHHGIDYATAKAMLGAMAVVPIAASASVMGLGYWTFAAEILLTVWAGWRITAPKPHGHLLKFFAIGGVGLLIGTVQGVIQVLPDNEAWIQASAPAGEYIDPIAHAHVNLVTGTLSLVAALVFYFSTRERLTSAHRRAENVVFWTMVPGSLLFYASFMSLGWIEGHLMTDHRYSYSAAVAALGAWHIVPLMLAGILTLTGIWCLLVIVIRGWLVPPHASAAAPLLTVAVVTLAIGTLQGLAQILPEVKAFLVAAGEPGDAIPNAHAQLNMLGGVLPALLAVTVIDAPSLMRMSVSRAFTLRMARLVGGGVGIYWASAMVTNIVMGRVVAGGGSLDAALRTAMPLGGIGMAIGATLYTAGFGTLALPAWRATASYRSDGWRNLLGWIESYNGEPAGWRRRIPTRYLLAAEAVSAFSGFPGLGWMLAGLPLIGLPLMLGGPPVAWAVLPMLSSPWGDSPLAWLGMWQTVAIYLAGSSLASVGALAAAMRLRRRAASPALTPALRPRLGESEQRA